MTTSFTLQYDMAQQKNINHTEPKLPTYLPTKIITLSWNSKFFSIPIVDSLTRTELSYIVEYSVTNDWPSVIFQPYNCPAIGQPLLLIVSLLLKGYSTLIRTVEPSAIFDLTTWIKKFCSANFYLDLFIVFNEACDQLIFYQQKPYKC